MNKRTIKPAAGKSRITPEAAEAAAFYVYRDPGTGRLLISKEPIPELESARRRRTAMSHRASARGATAKKR